MQSTPIQASLLLETERRTSCNVEQLVIELPEFLDPARLERAIGAVCARHLVLHAAFRRAAEGYVLVPQDAYRPTLHSAKTLTVGNDWEEYLEYWLGDDRGRPFPADTPPQRWSLLPRPEGTCLVWTYHHALLDGRSISTVIAEIFELYGAGTEGRPRTLPASSDYASYLALHASPVPKESLEFFRRYLEGLKEPTVLDMGPVCHPILHPTRHKEVHLQVDSAVVSEAVAWVEKEGLTLNSLVQAAWAITLAQYGDVEDVVFGATRAGRHGTIEGAADCVGVFMNTLPLRVSVRPQARALELCRQLRADALALRRHERTPLSSIQGVTDLPGGQFLLGTLYLFEYGTHESQLRGAHPRLRNAKIRLVEETSFDFTLIARAPGSPEDAASGLHLAAEFDVERYEEALVRRLLRQVARLVEAIVRRPDVSILDLPTLDEAERQHQQELLTGAPLEAPSVGVVPLFLDRAERSPTRDAVSHRGASRSYAELAEASRRVALRLRAGGVGKGDRVVVCLPRCLESPEVILGVLRSGAAYVPLGPEEAPERRAAILEDCRPRMIVTQRSLASRFEASKKGCLLIDGTHGPVPEGALREPDLQSAAYVMYTSGTTGRPKGVVVEHAQLAHHLAAARALLGMTEGAACLQFASFSFDVSVEELFGGLTRGAHLHLRSPEMIGSARSFWDAVERLDISVVNLPTAFFQEMVEGLRTQRRKMPPCLKTVIVGGEKVPAESLEQFREVSAHPVRFVNGYGPTETTVTSTAFELGEGSPLPPCRDTVPIGRPLPGCRHRVVDRSGRDLPVGAVGELIVLGPRVARGYLEQPIQTGERFIESGGERGYRTGDRVRLSSDGHLHFVGRRDDQVKVRGFRVELGEIEAALAKHASVREAFVFESPTQRGYLIGCVSGTESELSATALVEHARSRLLPHMIPRSLHVFSNFPKTSAGKVDRVELRKRALALPTASAEPSPLTGRARQLESIWTSLLGVPSIDPSESFFELGGHSLLAVRMFSQVEKATGVRIEASDFFGDPTIERLVELCGELDEEDPDNVDAKLHLDLRGEQGGEVASLVPLQTQGAGTPLYMVCGISLYEDLAIALGTDRPTFGLFVPIEARMVQALSDGGVAEEQFPSVEELAEGYVAGIVAHQPVGPYRVGGISFGGVLAYEVARQLRARGQVVENLLLLDSFLPSAWTVGLRTWLRSQVAAALRDPASLKRGISLTMDALGDNLERVGRAVAKRALSRGQSLWGRSSRDPKDELYDALVGQDRESVTALRTRAYHDAAYRYEPSMRPYDGNAILVRSLEHPKPPGYELDPSYGWGKHVRGRLTLHDVAGDHLGILQAPHVSDLAHFLRDQFRGDPPSFEALLERHDL